MLLGRGTKMMMVMKKKNQDGLYKLETLTYLHKVLMMKRKFSKSH